MRTEQHNDQSDFAALEARVARLENWRIWLPILAMTVCIGVVLAVIIAKPRPLIADLELGQLLAELQRRVDSQAKPEP